MSATEAIGYAYVLATQLGNGCNLSIQGNIALSATGPQMDKQFDKLMEVMDRLRARAEIPLLQAELEQRLTAQTNMLDEVARLEAVVNVKEGGNDTGNRRTPVNVANERAAIENTKVSLIKVRADIERARKAISDAEAKAAPRVEQAE
jgi:hypothetical protein